MSEFSITVSEVSKRFGRQRRFGGLLLGAMPWPVGWLARRRGRPLVAAIEPVSFTVGAGVHLELTGRENIFPESTLMGMPQQAPAFQLNSSLEVQKASCYNNGVNGWFHFDYDFSYSPAISGHAKENET